VAAKGRQTVKKLHMHCCCCCCCQRRGLVQAKNAQPPSFLLLPFFDDTCMTLEPARNRCASPIYIVPPCLNSTKTMASIGRTALPCVHSVQTVNRRVVVYVVGSTRTRCTQAEQAAFSSPPPPRLGNPIQLYRFDCTVCSSRL
jgi:hypothetical protein